MDGSDNMMLVTKHWLPADNENSEMIIRTILSLVRNCFNPGQKKRYSLDATVIDRLCTARAPYIIVEELKSRRVTSISKS